MPMQKAKGLNSGTFLKYLSCSLLRFYPSHHPTLVRKQPRTVSWHCFDCTLYQGNNAMGSVNRLHTREGIR